jgi:hypothetical protein
MSGDVDLVELIRVFLCVGLCVFAVSRVSRLTNRKDAETQSPTQRSDHETLRYLGCLNDCTSRSSLRTI